MPGLLELLFELLLELLDVPTALFALHAKHLQLLIVMTSSDRISDVSEHRCVLLEISRVLEVLELLGWLDSELCAQLLVLVLLVHPIALTITNFVSQVTARRDQIHVVAHNQDVVSSVDLPFDIKSLLQRLHGVLQELALVFVLLLDVGVYVSILRFLVFDETEETLIDCNFKLLMIIGVLHDLVDCVFEVVDVRLVVPDDISVRLNGLLDDTLSKSEVLDHVT